MNFLFGFEVFIYATLAVGGGAGISIVTKCLLLFYFNINIMK
jgi:hypothetical protein